MKIPEQEEVLLNDKKNMLVSASAGSGKTYIMIKYITKLICEERIPVKDFLVLTFTKAAATEMKERLLKSLKKKGDDPFIIEQIDSLSVANISTIHSFCEKNLKKYANLLGISENFAIADENYSQKIRQNAFDVAFKKLNEQNFEEYFELISNFKNDKNKVREILFEIENLVNSVADKEQFLKDNEEKNEKYFECATDFLFKNCIEKIESALDSVEKLHVEDFYFTLSKNLSNILNSKDIYQLAVACKEFSFPYLPKRKEVGDEVVENLKSIKDSINKAVNNIEILNLDNDDVVEIQKHGLLEKILTKLFKLYENEENEIKKSQNILDFYDLEKYMKKLSVEENLFTGLKFVFVDEYQDTNKVQERIIKNVAKNCNFVAVGDVKQGIYGFRLASSEIFLKDVSDFEKEENSTVKYLKSNFRSNKNVLNFVNDIFKVCMTKETCGVDYKNTSMLEGVSPFVDDGQKTVYIDLLKKNEIEKEELPAIYSVKKANLYVDNQNLVQIEDVKRRINEVMSSQISDGGQLRKCRYSDIAILSRKRDALFNQIEIYLQKSGVPVISNSRSVLLDEPEIKVLLSYLKIALNADDDVSMLSVLLSGLSDVSLQQIVDEKSKNDLSLCEIVIKDDKKIFENFNKNLNEFKFDVLVWGARKAFLKLFAETNYRAYINEKINHSKINLFVDKFLNEISASDFEFDLAGLINYFESVEITVTSEISAVEDSVLLTTIHNSKGLEYPIVFLIGCDQSLKKSQPKVDVEINEKFGLGVKFYDKNNNQEVETVKMKAIKTFESQKDFEEELMIFYVALTRAKNRLYLFGNIKDNIFERYDVKDCDSYFELIFYSMPKIKAEFLKNNFYEDKNMAISYIENVEEIDLSEKQNFENMQILPKIQEKILNYLNFKYKIDDKLNFRLKESVTSLNNKNDEDVLSKYSNENFTFSNNSIETGNAYHLVLKVLDFKKISSMAELNQEIDNNLDILKDAIMLVDKEILLKNIILLRKFTDNGVVFKEKEFIMKDKISNLLENVSLDDEILVQGVIDLFVVKNNEIILIDYKYSNSNSEKYLIEKYKNQIKLYKKALENAQNLKVGASFLLSLRNNKLIQIDK